MKLALLAALLVVSLGCSWTQSTSPETCPGAAACCPAAAATCPMAAAAEPMLAHNVYFTLKENTPAAREALVAGCNTYLRGAPGVVCFAAGTLAEDLNRDVNVRDFQVALHIFFKTKADQDAYQTSEKHQEFIAKCKDLWTSVRVFDSYVK